MVISVVKTLVEKVVNRLVIYVLKRLRFTQKNRRLASRALDRLELGVIMRDRIRVYDLKYIKIQEQLIEIYCLFLNKMSHVKLNCSHSFCFIHLYTYLSNIDTFRYF